MNKIREEMETLQWTPEKFRSLGDPAKIIFPQTRTDP